MSFSFELFTGELKKALDLFDKEKATALCTALMNVLFDTEEQLTAKQLETTLQQLRNKRMFFIMQRLADCCIQTGRQTNKIRRQYAQSLIEQGIYSAALSVLIQLKNDTAHEDKVENDEAVGLIGRVYKQMYVNNGKPGIKHYEQLLKLAVENYAAVYASDPENSLWHGINLVALLKRAAADGIKPDDIADADSIAKEILSFVEDKETAGRVYSFDLATAVEACVALQNKEAASVWTEKYVNAAGTDAFEFGSTLRQLQEVWKLDSDSDLGKAVIPVLQSALLKKEGGNVVLDFNRVDIRELTGVAYNKKLEKTFGTDSFNTYEWYCKGLNCCKAVVRIGKETSIGVGTGFLMKGDDLHNDLKDKVVLLTNAHVLSNNPDKNYDSYLPEDCVATMQVIDRDKELHFREIFWSSFADELDVSILLFDEDSHTWLKEMVRKGDIVFYKVREKLPEANGKQRVYIIGHPGGGTLQLSLQDNVFLGKKDPYIHYRTPTEGGSSGSPVFNDKWELIGIHHAGDEHMQKLDNPAKTYEANEGIWIQSILEKIGKK